MRGRKSLRGVRESLCCTGLADGEEEEGEGHDFAVATSTLEKFSQGRNRHRWERKIRNEAAVGAAASANGSTSTSTSTENIHEKSLSVRTSTIDMKGESPVAGIISEATSLDEPARSMKKEDG